MASVKSILRRYVGSKLNADQLFSIIQTEVKKNIGNGVSQEYFDKAYSDTGYINASNIKSQIWKASKNYGNYDINYMRSRKKQIDKEKKEQEQLSLF